MPQLGAGIIPNGPIGFELEATVRRVFSQMVVVLIYKQNPLLALLLRNAIRASGGVSPYTQPVQTGRYVNSSWIGPAGNFDIPPDVAATVNAEFNMCALATPVTSFGLAAGDAGRHRSDQPADVETQRHEEQRTRCLVSLAVHLVRREPAADVRPQRRLWHGRSGADLRGPLPRDLSRVGRVGPHGRRRLAHTRGDAAPHPAVRLECRR